MVQIFQNLMKTTDSRNLLKPRNKKTTPRFTVIKCLKQVRKKYFKAAKEIRYIERKKYKDDRIFLVEKKMHEIQLSNIFKVLKERNLLLRSLYLIKTSFKNRSGWGKELFRHCCSVAHLCPTLFDPIDGSTPSFLVLSCLLEFAQTHVP